MLSPRTARANHASYIDLVGQDGRIIHPNERIDTAPPLYVPPRQKKESAFSDTTEGSTSSPVMAKQKDSQVPTAEVEGTVLPAIQQPPSTSTTESNNAATSGANVHLTVFSLNHQSASTGAIAVSTDVPANRKRSSLQPPFRKRSSTLQIVASDIPNSFKGRTLKEQVSVARKLSSVLQELNECYDDEEEHGHEDEKEIGIYAVPHDDTG
jgi:hypothetical protein